MSRRRRRAGAESGMTVVEVVIASLLLALASLAAFSVIDTGRRNTSRAEGSQVAVNLAERELEAIRALDYADVAMSAAPSPSSDPDDPRSRVSGSSFALNRDGTNLAPMVVAAGGAVSPGPIPFTSGDVSGDIYRFVTWQDAPDIAGAQNFKRVVLAASVNATATTPERGYFEIHSDVTDPNDGVTGTGAPPGPGAESNQVNYWLSDTQTTAAAGCDPTRVSPSGHAAHNTTGSCGGASGPDYAFRTPAATGAGVLPDYSTDLPGAQGLQLAANAGLGGSCDMSAGATQVHRWVTPALNLNLTRDAGITLYTRQPAAVEGPGTICFAIVQALDLGALVATAGVYAPDGGPALAGWSCAQVTTVVTALPLTVLVQHVCSTATYPNDWEAIEIRVGYPVDINLTSRVTAALAVRAQQPGPDGIQFMYDHARYPSRLSFTPTL